MPVASPRRGNVFKRLVDPKLTFYTSEKSFKRRFGIGKKSNVYIEGPQIRTTPGMFFTVKAPERNQVT